MKNNRRFSQLIVFLVLIYFFYVVGNTLYQSYKVRKEIEDLKDSVSEMQQSNKELSEKIIYYQSASYRERIARERLGLQKPGEEVMVILPEERKEVAEKDPDEGLPNWQKWYKFFFKS